MELKSCVNSKYLRYEPPWNESVALTLSIFATSAAYSPYWGVQSDAFRVDQVHVNDRDTRVSSRAANEYPVAHTVHKIEVSGEPINGHMFHIYKTKQEKTLWGINKPWWGGKKHIISTSSWELKVTFSV